MNNNVLKALTLALTFSGIGLKAQTPFTNYFCELDTIFNKGEKISSQNLLKNVTWGSNQTKKNKATSSGTIAGLTINRNSQPIYYTGSSNIKTFAVANLYTTHNYDSNGIKSSLIGKTASGFNIGENLKVNKFEYLNYPADLYPYPIQLGKITLGTTNFQTSDARGNIFTFEKFYNSNVDVKATGNDTFNNTKSPTITPSTYPNDNSDYSAILGQLNSSQFTGWIVEIDRLNNTFQKRRFDLGRAPRKVLYLNSSRTSASGSNAEVARTFQILGDEGFNVLVKTELNNNVQEFYVYSEQENTLGSHWTLVNTVSSGKIQSLSKEALLDLFNYIAKSDLEFSYLLNITDLKINETTNTIILTTPGGTANVSDFKAKLNLTVEPVMASYLTKLLSGNSYTDKFGQIIEIDGNDETVVFPLGFQTSTGKFISNIENVQFFNLNYNDAKSDPQNTSYAILSERVFENSAGQNPKYKKNSTEFQNEVFLVNLESITDKSNTVDFSTKTFELFQTLPNNTVAIPASYTEMYLPYIYVAQNNNSQIDSLSMIRGFAEYFINPTLCEKTNSNEDLEVTASSNMVYPNPVKQENGICVIQLKHPENVAIYTIHGSFVGSFKNSTTLTLDNIHPGLYIIKGEKGLSEILMVN